MSAMAGVKQLHIIQRNSRWWNTPLTTQEKLSYYGFIVSSVVRAVSTKNKQIRYLGTTLYYDNVVTPLNLQLYPYEISKSIISNIPSVRLKKVLDIGGNIGQFSLTLSHALGDKVKIDVLEPNSEIFELLKKNTSSKKNIRVFNFGVGKPIVKHMYYTPGKSGTGSMFKANTTVKSMAKKTSITVVDDIACVTECSQYDLVKIDVEGYEFDLLEAIKPIDIKMMFIEISGLARYKDYSHSRLFSLIESKFGEFEILHMSHCNISSNHFDALLRFV